MYEGIFNTEIEMSGDVMKKWDMVEEKREREFRIGEVMGCKKKERREIVEFMRKVKEKRLVEDEVKEKNDEERERKMMYFEKNIEKGAQKGEEVFIKGKNMEIMKEGRLKKVKFM
jgi:hypothetical protein